MGVDTCCYLPHYVRIRDVAKVIGATVGLPKRRTSLNGPYQRTEAWYVEVPDIKIKACEGEMVECAQILWRDLDGEKRYVLFHFEPSNGKGRLIRPRSTPFWIAVCKRLADFFGGEVVYRDSNGKEPDYVVPPRSLEEVTPEDGEPWITFQQRLLDIPPLTRAEYEDARQYAAYDDVEWEVLDILEGKMPPPFADGNPIVFEDVALFESEDGGMAQIAQIPSGEDVEEEDDDEGFFVRLQSYSRNCHHPVVDQMRGRRVRVTVEILED